MRREGGGLPDRELTDAVEQIELPIALIDLEDFAVLAISLAGVNRLGDPGRSIVGRSIIEVLPEMDRQRAEVALAAMRAGSIDFFQAHGLADDRWSSPEPTVIWVR